MLEILIPCAGEGRRFQEAGYTVPKPQIDIAGKPMIQRVMDCLTPAEPHRFRLLGKEQVGETQGAVDTLLHGRALINPANPVLVANCDQLIDPGHIEVFLRVPHSGLRTGCDAAIMTFNSTNPHHSYVKLDGYRVTEIAEKVVISDNAVLGVYWFSSGQLLMDYAEKVIANNLRYGNGEFYISSILALMVGDGLDIATYEVDVHERHMLGTPEELRIYLDKVESGRVTL
jgi:NDP-sugar pyrophosphorylase family protein